MRYLLSCLLVGGFIGLVGCNLAGLNNPLGDGSDVEPIVLSDTRSPESYDMDPYEVVNLANDTDTSQFEFAITSDTLALRVSYRGGCKEHNFGLVGPKSFKESYPSQADLLLTHDDRGDDCQEKKTEIIRFDLSPLKQQHLQSYPGYPRSPGDPKIISLRPSNQTAQRGFPSVIAYYF